MKPPLGYSQLLACQAIIRRTDRVRCVLNNGLWEHPWGLLGNRVCRAAEYGWQVCRKGDQATLLDILRIRHRYSLDESKKNLAAQFGLTVRQITEIVG